MSVATRVLTGQALADALEDVARLDRKSVV